MAVLSAKAAASRLGVNPSRIRQLILEGSLRARKFAGSWAIREEDLNRYASSVKSKKP